MILNDLITFLNNFTHNRGDVRFYFFTTVLAFDIGHGIIRLNIKRIRCSNLAQISQICERNRNFSQ